MKQLLLRFYIQIDVENTENARFRAVQMLKNTVTFEPLMQCTSYYIHFWRGNESTNPFSGIKFD